jgi:hypothetical protein
MLRGWYKNQVDRADFDIQKMPIGQTDLDRLARGMIGGQFWSAFVPWFVFLSSPSTTLYHRPTQNSKEVTLTLPTTSY